MDTPANVTGPVNIGNPDEFSILELAQMVIHLVGSRSKIVHGPLPDDDPKQRQPDISRARELLGWKPHVAIKEGLTRTIAYFERLLSEPAFGSQLNKEALLTGAATRAPGRLSLVEEPGMSRSSLRGNREIPRQTSGNK